MTGLMFFCSAVILIVDILIAMEFKHIAAEKGYDEGKYFWWSFFLIIIGWLMVIALPDRGANTSMRKPNEDEIPDL